MESEKKNDLTKTFFMLGNMAKSTNSDDKNTREFLVKAVYFGNVKDVKNITRKFENWNEKTSVHRIYFKWFEENLTKLWCS